MRFRQRPREIDAIQYTGNNADEIVGWHRRLCEKHPHSCYDKLVEETTTWGPVFHLESSSGQESITLAPKGWLVFNGAWFQIFTESEMQKEWEKIEESQP
jgi:hypothetical protein